MHVPLGLPPPPMFVLLFPLPLLPSLTLLLALLPPPSLTCSPPLLVPLPPMPRVTLLPRPPPLPEDLLSCLLAPRSWVRPPRECTRRARLKLKRTSPGSKHLLVGGAPLVMALTEPGTLVQDGHARLTARYRGMDTSTTEFQEGHPDLHVAPAPREDAWRLRVQAPPGVRGRGAVAGARLGGGRGHAAVGGAAQGASRARAGQAPGGDVALQGRREGEVSARHAQGGRAGTATFGRGSESLPCEGTRGRGTRTPPSGRPGGPGS